MPTQCCVPQCNQKGGHSFPWSNKELFQKWMIAVKRDDKWKPTKYSVVCKAHFDISDYVELNYYGNTPMQKRLKPDAVPHIFSWIDSPIMATSDWIQESLEMKRDQLEADSDPLAVKYVEAIEEVGAQQTEGLIMPQRKRYGSSYCSAVGCTNSLRKCTALSFFRFPKDEARSKLWVVNSKRVDLYKFGADYLYENCRLCALHFEDTEFMNPALKNKLVWSAVPTLFPSESNTSSQTTSGKSLEEEQYSDDLSTATPPSQNEVPQSPKRKKLDCEVLNLRVARSRSKRKAKSLKKANNTDPKTYTEDMTSRMAEAECSPSRRRSSSNSSSVNMLSINNEENGVQESHECSLCNKSFPEKALLETHIDEHYEKSYECNVCNKIFKCKSHLKEHMDIHSQENIYECDICYSRFVQRNHLKSHLTLHDRLKKYECNICHKGFTVQKHFNAHMSMHDEGKRFKCSLCNRRFTCNKYLSGHMVVHTKEKKYECNICGKRFTQRSSIKPHMVLHSGEQNYECDICKKKFNYKQNVRKHMKLHTGEKKYECDICKKCFAENCGLKSHMLSHSKVKRYECHMCDKKFKSSAHLGSHLEAHSAEKNFSCDICRKRFKRKENLKKHKALHINNFKAKTIYQCHICGEKYELESMFKQHVLSHSNDRENEIPFEFVEIPSFVKKETDDSSHGDTSENVFDDMCDETQDRSCTVKVEVEDIKTENYFEDT